MRILTPIIDKRLSDKKGWQTSLNLKYDLGENSYLEMQKNSEFGEKLDKVISRNERQIKNDFRSKIKLLTEYYQKMGKKYNFTQLKGLELQKSVQDLYMKQKQINQQPRNYIKYGEDLELFYCLDEIEKQKRHNKLKERLQQIQQSQYQQEEVPLQFISQPNSETGLMTSHKTIPQDAQEQKPKEKTEEELERERELQKIKEIQQKYYKNLMVGSMNTFEVFEPVFKYDKEKMQFQKKYNKVDQDSNKKLLMEGQQISNRQEIINQMLSEGKFVMEMTDETSFNQQSLQLKKSKLLNSANTAANVGANGDKNLNVKKDFTKEFNDTNYIYQKMTKEEKLSQKKLEKIKMEKYEKFQSQVKSDIDKDIQSLNQAMFDPNYRKLKVESIPVNELEELYSKLNLQKNKMWQKCMTPRGTDRRELISTAPQTARYHREYSKYNPESPKYFNLKTPRSFKPQTNNFTQNK